MEAQYPTLRFDLNRDRFVLWIRWVSMETPPCPDEPPNQGIRAELKLNGNPIFGPTVLFRRDLTHPVYLVANSQRTRDVIRTAAASEKALLDIQLIVHGSIAHAPYAALFHLRDYRGEAIDTTSIAATPLLQVQPSTPADRWQVAGQCNLRTRVEVSENQDALPVIA